MQETAASGTHAPAALRERAFFFHNPDGRQLYAVLHSAIGTAASGLGVLFCAPLAEERYCSQRALVDYARELARNGHASLRFDAAGTGDSEGAMAGVTIDSLLGDVRSAVSRLAQEPGINHVVLIGVRFGALLARLAAEADERVFGVVLAAPVVAGGDYVAAMLRSQQMACMTRGLKPPTTAELRQMLAVEEQVEIKGEFFSRRFCEQLTTVDLLSLPARFCGPQLIVGAVDEPVRRDRTAALADTARRGGSKVTAMADKVGVFWTGKSLYEGFRPHNLYRATIDWLAVQRP